MGFIDNMARSGMWVIAVATLGCSAALVPVRQAQRQAREKAVRISFPALALAQFFSLRLTS